MLGLRALYGGLEALYGTESGVDPTSFLVPFDARPQHGPEQLIVRQHEGELEVALALDRELLTRMATIPVGKLLDDATLPDCLPALEGLSHLLYVCEAARRGRPISGLELETQAEVDKFAMCLLHRWPVDESKAATLLHRLFFEFALADGLSPDLRRRYRRANRLALGFARHLVRFAAARSLQGFRRALHDFWHRPMADKVYLAGASSIG